MADCGAADNQRSRKHVRGATARWMRRCERLVPGRARDRPDTPDLHVTAVRRLPAVAAQYAPFPAALDDAAQQALAARGIAQLYTHQAEAIEHALAPAHASSSRRPRRARRSATTRRFSTRSSRIRRAARCICFRRRRSRRISSPSCRRCARSIDQRSGRADRRLHLRRRYAAGRPAHDPRTRAPRAQQSRHGAFGHPAASSALGEAVREPPLRRHRRAARVSRRLRQPPVQRAAAAAAHLPPLRIGPGVPVFVGDDRQPARARRTAHRAAVRARRPERRAARREVLRLRESAGRQPPARHPPLVSRAKRAGSRRSS